MPAFILKRPHRLPRRVRSSLDAPLLDEPRDYVGRPGISPALAALVSAGLLCPDHRVLDVGCGRGTDLLALARLGFRRLEGLDHNAASLRVAKRRERDARQGRQGGQGRQATPWIAWHWATLDKLLEFSPASFDWIVDTFLLNNLREADEAEYLRRLARLLPRGGGLLLHVKYGARSWERDGRRGARSPCFDAGAPVLTWWAEGGAAASRHVSGYVQVMRRNRAVLRM